MYIIIIDIDSIYKNNDNTKYYLFQTLRYYIILITISHCSLTKYGNVSKSKAKEKYDDHKKWSSSFV